MMRQYELVERVQRYKPDVNEALLNKAYVYAMQKHGHQKRASGAPYIPHPLEVAAILTDMHLDESTIAVALLPDTTEDTTTTRAEIDALLGEDIGRLVEGLTKLKRLDLVTTESPSGGPGGGRLPEPRQDRRHAARGHRRERNRQSRRRSAVDRPPVKRSANRNGRGRRRARRPHRQ